MSNNNVKKAKKNQSPLVQATVDGIGSSRTSQMKANIKNNEKRTKGYNVEHSKKAKRKRSQNDLDDEAEERRLTALLFGGKQQQQQQQDVAAPASLDSDSDEEQEATGNTYKLKSGVEGSSGLFELDTQGDADEAEQEEEQEEQEMDHESATSDGSESDKVAWVDDDDNEVEMDMMKTNRLKKLKTHRDEQVSALTGKDLEQRLRKRFELTTMITARTDWAKFDELKTNNEQIEEASATPLLASSAYGLPPHILQLVRCPDANQSDPSQAVLQATHFHPGSDPDRPLMLTAGLDKTLRFFHVGADGSEKIHGIHFPKLPIYSAQFLGDTGNVVVSGRRSFFYIYNAAAGKLDLVPRIMGREEKSLEKFTASPDGRIIAFIGNDGYIILVDAKSKQWMMDLKMNGNTRAVTFTPNSDYLIASGSDGDVYRFDLRTRRCVERFANEDGGITSSLSVSFKHLAVGSESGVVNLYSDRKIQKPIKSLMNLQTSSDFSCFNDDGNILAFSSRREKNSLKLLHVPTATVFSNWPTSKTPLSYVWSVGFSPESKFLSIGNDKGNCLLYKLLHYHE